MTGNKRLFFEMFNRAGGARRRALHDLFRLSELSRRLQEPAHAVDDAAREPLRRHPAVRRPGRAVHRRADGQRLEERLCRAVGRRTRRGNRCDDQRHPHLPDGLPVPVPRLPGRAGGLRADRLRAGGDGVHAGQPRLDDGAAFQRHGRRGAARGAVLPAGRRSDDLGQRHRAHDHAVADAGRAFARRARAGGDALQHVLRRHLRLVGRRRRRALAHARAGDEARRLRPRLHRRADRLGVDDGKPDPAQHHGGGLWRDRQRVDRRPVSRRRGARRAGRHRPDDLQPFLRAGRHQAPARHVRRSSHGDQASRRAADDPADHHGRHPDRPLHADRSRHHCRRLHCVRRDPAAQLRHLRQSAARHGA